MIASPFWRRSQLAWSPQSARPLFSCFHSELRSTWFATKEVSVVSARLGPMSRFFARVVFYASLGHLVEIGFWALLFMICREFRDFGTAFYHSAVNYTSLGYGDLIMSPSWRLLGPLETANGALLFGVSTAMIFAVILWLIQIRFKDLKD